MAYIPGYTYDIFISYAHLDNLKMPGQQLGWIELFYQSLTLKLAQRIGKQDAVKIWWDSKKLDGGKLFDNSIEDGIRDSAIMISLISPGYLQSEYCKKEMDLFYSKSALEKTGTSIGDNARMIKVLLNNIPHVQIPEQFGRATGFPFYKAADNNDFGDPLDYTDPVFTAQLKDLRDALIGIFQAFPKEQPPAIPSANAPIQNTAPPAANSVSPIDPVKSDAAKTDADSPGKGFSIYFGEVSDSLRTARKRTIVDLTKSGYSIITNVPPPDEATAHEQKVAEAVQGADLAVHLLDQFPGREIEGTDNWYPRKQVEISLQLAPAKLIWVPADLNEQDVEEETYKTFLLGIEHNNNSENKFDFIRGNKSELTDQIRDYADAIIQSRVRKDSNEKISVLLDTHFSDQQYAFSLGQALLQNNMQPYINPQEDDPHKNIEMLADRISQVNKLVFLYGHVSREWVLERMSAALQLIVTHNYPIDDFYIYMAPPNKTADDIKLNQRFLKVNVLNNSADTLLNPGALDAFIADMKQRSAA
jgi:hypothetical protein